MDADSLARLVTHALLRLYAALLRRLKPNVGLTRLSFNRFTDRLFRGIGRTLDAPLPGGATIEVDPHEYHGRVLWLCGSNDWKVSRVVCALLRPGDVFLDIGANNGSIGFAAAERVRAGGVVHFFEPQAQVADRLRSAISMAGSPALHLHRIALSDTDGTAELSGSSHHSGVATLLPQDAAERPFDRSETVTTRDAAGYLTPLVGAAPVGAKIDVEGAEPLVLPGLAALPGLRFIVFEGASNEAWLWDFFQRHGFRIFGLVRSPVRPRAREVTEFAAWPAFHDFVALRTRRPPPHRDLAYTDLARCLG